jgi:hypothetical protein
MDCDGCAFGFDLWIRRKCGKIYFKSTRAEDLNWGDAN